jgi:hypothetical protein
LVGGYGVALALAITSAFDAWRFDGVNKTAMVIAMLVALVCGTVFLVLGVRVRYVKLAEIFDKLKHSAGHSAD